MLSRLLQRYVDNCAAQFPDKEAVIDGQSRISYQDLFVQSNRLARCLIHNNMPRKSHVVICMKRSVQYIVAMIGVLKADADYIPIEARTPDHRRNQIIKDCNAYAIIGDDDTIPKILLDRSISELPQLIVSLGSKNYRQPSSHANLITLDKLKLHNADPLDYSNEDTDLACIIYTSGSTGIPKGVMISHINIDDYVAWAAERFGISSNDKILSTAPFYFDMSLFDIFCSLKVGATLCVATERVVLFPAKLIEFAESEGVTIWKGISSLLMYLARVGAISRGRLPTLKTILFGGEALHAKYLIEWMRIFPEKTFYNVYGPTEATGISMYYRVEQVPKSAHERIPIGKPCENTEIFLLDQDHKLVSPGHRGELFIKSICVTRGYLNDLEKTERAFIDNPFSPTYGERIYGTGDYARLRKDGNYEFLGRKDDQVKFMGYRIELSDIEQTLASIDGVRDAGAILAESSLTGLEELVACVELDDMVPLSGIVEEAKKRLPHYMMPKHLIPIGCVPRSDRGKINRQALHNHYRNKEHGE